MKTGVALLPIFALACSPAASASTTNNDVPAKAMPVRIAKPDASPRARLQQERAELTRARRKAELFRLSREDLRSAERGEVPAIPVMPVSVTNDSAQVELPGVPKLPAVLIDDEKAIAGSGACGALALADATITCASRM